MVFRRSRLEAGRDAGRRIHTVRVRPTAADRAMFDALAALTRAVRRESADLQRPIWLMLSLLHKRALSSAFALAASAERRLALLDSSGSIEGEQLRLPLDDGGELDAADAAPMWSEPALENRQQERRLLERVIDTARRASGFESKLARLRRMLRRLGEPAIVFTEYRDTLMHLRDHVAPDAAVIHGGLSREQRRTALDAFPAAGVLLATDAAGEGLNLQHRCRIVINLELPWNPMRLEQRIGRVDRIGQNRRVHAFHLVADGTGETALLDRLSLRVRRARASVGAPDPLGGRPEWTEDASARLVVLGADSVRAAPQAPGGDGPRIPLLRLEAEAFDERMRLLLARQVAAAARRSGSTTPSPNAPTPLVCWARRRSLRAIIGRCAVAVFRTTISDADGRPVASRIDSLLCGPTAGTRAAALAVDTHGVELFAAARTRWVEDAVRIQADFARVRLARARRLAAIADAPWAQMQPGLFDRRVQQQHDLQSAVQQNLVAATRERVDRAEAASHCTVSDPQLALVLVASRQSATTP
jgi:hypothetical protein